jgi:hypothetical protein
LAPTVGIAATGFCYLGGIFQLSSRRSGNFFFIDINDGAYIAATMSYQPVNMKIKKRRES